MSNPIRLCEYSGISLSNKDIADWLRAWADAIETRPPIKNLIMIGEAANGDTQIISTGAAIDTARVVGVVTIALSRHHAGDGDDVFYDKRRD